MKITSLQEVRFTDTGTSGTETITSVNTSNTVLFVTYGFDSGSATSPDNVCVRFWLSDSTTLNWDRHSDSEGFTLQASIYVAELSDVTIQTGTTLMTSAQEDESISTVDLADTFVVHSWKNESTFSSGTADSMTIVHLTSTTNLRVETVQYDASRQSTSTWYLIESTDLTVQSGSITGIFEGDSDFDDSITSVTLADTFLVGYDMHADGSTTRHYCLGYLKNATTVTARLNSNDPGPAFSHQYWYFVVENSAQDVQQIGDTIANSTTGNDTISTIDQDLTVVIKTGALAVANGGSLQHMPFEYWFSDTTTLNWRRGAAESGTEAFWQAVEFAPGASWEQEGYRWRDDDDDEASATWLVAQDTTTSVFKQTTIRLRVLSNATGNPPTATATLQFRKQGDAATEWETIA